MYISKNYSRYKKFLAIEKSTCPITGPSLHLRYSYEKKKNRERALTHFILLLKDIKQKIDIKYDCNQLKYG